MIISSLFYIIIIKIGHYYIYMYLIRMKQISNNNSKILLYIIVSENLIFRRKMLKMYDF
jgi:hypothetical protein